MKGEDVLQTFAVFSGGGVKGAALAGALYAAEDLDYQFLGFGGTSAGALVAAMASVGYNGEEIKASMLEDGVASPGKIFAEGNANVAHFLDALGELGKAKGIKRAAIRYYRLPKEQKESIKAVITQYGVLTGESLKAALAEMFAAKLGVQVADARNMDFETFVGKTGKPLKIVASDVWSGRPRVYSRGRSPKLSVIDALAASAAFPCAFAPTRGLAGSELSAVLVDGGLASNTPAFLFHEEWRMTRFPTIVFQLVESNPGGDFPKDALDYAGGLVRTAVNAGDQIIGDMLPFVHAIDIEGLEGFNVIDPRLDDVGVQRLFEIGERKARPRLNGLVELRRAKGVLPKGVTDFARRYGAPAAFDTALSAMRFQMTLDMRSRGRPIQAPDDLRVAVFLPLLDPANVKDPKRSRWAIGFEYGFGDAEDRKIQFEYGQGCTGKAVETGQAIFDDTAQRRIDPAATGMTAEQLATVPHHRKSVIAIPVREYDLDSELSADERPIVAVLTVDSSLPLAETGWVAPVPDGHESAPRVDEETLRILDSWAGLVARLLFA